MALSQIVRVECPVCKKVAVETSRMKLGSSILIKLQCGHLLSKQSLVSTKESVYESIVFSDGCKPRPYQIDGIKFAEESDVRCLIADEQGLGKTIQVASLLRLHPEILLPAVIVVPATVKLQWLREIHRICGSPKDFLTQVIQSGKERAMPGFKVYVVTYDMLKNDDLFQFVEGQIKTIVIDECQRIKDHLSGRAKAVQKVARNCQHIVAMSGTPIKNHAGEYFTVLNLIKPTKFRHYQGFIEQYCDSYHNGWALKVGGLKDVEKFHEDTKDIVIRRTKAEVLKDLPPIDRKFYHVELNRKLNKEYADALDDLDNLLYNDDMNEFDRSTATIAIMQRLRHTTGLSKTVECIDFVAEFLMSCDRKITIFPHHQDVAGILVQKLDEICEQGGFAKVLNFHSGLGMFERDRMVQQFKDGPHRVMVASTLAAGEALNLQFCSDAIMLERQWNPANEEQAEGRFHRFGQQNSVTITYMIASETIDEYFTELVEIKRSIVGSAMDKKEVKWDQQSLMKELANMLVMKGRDKWKL